MGFIHLTISNIIYILFPVLLYFVAIAYNRTIDKKDNVLLLELSLFTSLYLIIIFGNGYLIDKPLYLLNIPLLVAFYKQRRGVSISLSVFLIIYLFLTFNYNLFLLIIDYILCYVIYTFIKNDKLKLGLFVVIKMLFIIIYTNANIYYNLIESVLFVLLYLLIIKIIDYIDNLMKFYMTLEDLEKEKQIRNSLFKISHEIKNPLAVCKGFLELMDGSEEKYQKYTPMINEHIDHALLILEDFSSVGKLKMDFDILDINGLIEDVINNLEPLLLSKNITVCFKNKDEIFINGDYLRLKQVFINLIKNSLEAFENIKKPKIIIKETIEKNIVTISLKDNGCGISKENLTKISEPFFTTKTKGTGLGTYLSSEIIKAHNASIKYSSDEGKGTLVELMFNIKEI